MAAKIGKISKIETRGKMRLNRHNSLILRPIWGGRVCRRRESNPYLYRFGLDFESSASPSPCTKKAFNTPRSAGFRTRMLSEWRFKAEGWVVGHVAEQKAILLATEREQKRCKRSGGLSLTQPAPSWHPRLRAGRGRHVSTGREIIGVTQ
jgi:hypothetical protein